MRTLSGGQYDIVADESVVLFIMYSVVRVFYVYLDGIIRGLWMSCEEMLF